MVQGEEAGFMGYVEEGGDGGWVVRVVEAGG